MSKPMKLLFICTGNVCRSVMAEQMTRKLARERGLAWEARSCGVAAENYFQVPPEVRAELALRGIADFEHRPQLVSRKLLAWCDAALVMTSEQRRVLIDAFPEFAAKIQLLRRRAGLDDEDVVDPIGKPREVYAACGRDIEQAVAALLGA